MGYLTLQALRFDLMACKLGLEVYLASMLDMGSQHVGRT